MARVLLAISLFCVGLVVIVPGVQGDPLGSCCKLANEVCDKAITKTWLDVHGESSGTATVTELSCGDILAYDNATEGSPNYDAIRGTTCNGGVTNTPGAIVIKGVSGQFRCVVDKASATGSKASSTEILCKYYYRCWWDTSENGADGKKGVCKPKSGYPKEFKTQYLVSNPMCSNDLDP